jgi:hypothetical protein
MFPPPHRGAPPWEPQRREGPEQDARREAPRRSILGPSDRNPPYADGDIPILRAEEER